MGKQKNRAKNGKDTGNTDWDSLSRQLKQHGFAVKEMIGDGNCLFRALGDQHEGHSRNHIQLRLQVVDYIKKNRSEFEPFCEDDEPFDEHVKNLAEPGTYGGNDAIVAFSRLFGVTVVIHQFNSPAWVINPVGEPKQARKELHISYHNGDHYNSVTKINNGTVVESKQIQTASPASSNTLTKTDKNNKGLKGRNGGSPQNVKSDPKFEDLKISDDSSKENERKDSPSIQNKGANKKMSRRQILEQKKKDRKQDAMQRKRVNSIGDSTPAINSVTTPASVKTLTI